MADDSWIGLLTGKRRNAFAKMAARGLWTPDSTTKDLDEFAEKDKTEARKQREDMKFDRNYHKTYYGRGRDIDRLKMAEKMAKRQDGIADAAGQESLRKRSRILGDGTTLKYKNLGGNIGKVVATVPEGQRVRTQPWSRSAKEILALMDDPDAMYQIQPAFLVWADPNGDPDEEPCGMLITRKFGPPYWYLPRILKTDDGDVTMFTLEEADANKGGGLKYSFEEAAHKEKTFYVSYQSSGIDDTTYITQRLAQCYRDAAGEYKYEQDDLKMDYHGMPEASNGMQELVAYNFTPDIFYGWYDCMQDMNVGQTEDDRKFQRVAPNYHGDSEVNYTEHNYLLGWYFREDEFWKGWNQKTRQFFEGDCGRIDVKEVEAIFDAKSRTSNWQNLFLMGYSFDNEGVNIDELHAIGGGSAWYKSGLWTIEWLLNYDPYSDHEDTWPYPNRGFGGVLTFGDWYTCVTTEATRNVGQLNDEANQYVIGFSGNTPYFYNYPIPLENNCRDNCHRWCSCIVPLGREWYHEGSNLYESIGQVLRSSDGTTTQEWAVFLEEHIMGDAYLDHWTVGNNFTDITAKTSRGYEHYFGKAGAYGFRSTYSIEGAVIYDCRSPKQAERKKLMTATIFEVSIQDGTNDQVTSYPQFLGPIRTWGDKHWGGGRTGSGLSGPSFSLTGSDRYEIAFIIAGSRHQPQLNANAPTMVIESGGQDAVCWRRVIAPDIIKIADQERYIWYSFAEEKLSAKWPPSVPISGVRPEDQDNGFPEGGHFRHGVVPVKIYWRPRNWLRTAHAPGKTEEHHAMDTYIEDDE